jgi:tripartite-type tricarboxylate transporter receptor subunit TctC
MRSFLIKRRALFAAFGALALALTAGTATSVKAEYPTKPINLMVGFSAGGGVDNYARALSSFIHEHLGMPMVVVNKAGAAGMIAAKFTVGRKADGYTLYITNTGSLLAKSLMDGAKSPIDPLVDIQPLGGAGQLVTGLFVPIDSPFKSAADLVAAAKAKPGKLRWSHPGRGSLHMLAGAAFLKSNGVTARDVPFKGGSKARNAVSGKQVDFAFMGVQLLTGFQTKLRALGVTTGKRDKVNPDIPTFGEQGLASLDIAGPMMMLGHKDLPADVIAKLVPAIKKIVGSKGFKKLTKNMGLSAFYFDPAAGKEKLKALKATLTPIVADVVKKK